MAKLPTAAWVCLTTAFLGILATLAFLSATDSDTSDFWRFLLTGGQIVAVILGGGGVVLAGQAARQTNGGLKDKIKEGVHEVLAERDAGERP